MLYLHTFGRVDLGRSKTTCIPSVDVLMSSVAEAFTHRAPGAIMTGMGSDGTQGMSAIYRQGGITIGPDKSEDLRCLWHAASLR